MKSSKTAQLQKAQAKEQFGRSTNSWAPSLAFQASILSFFTQLFSLRTFALLCIFALDPKRVGCPTYYRYLSNPKQYKLRLERTKSSPLLIAGEALKSSPLPPI